MKYHFYDSTFLLDSNDTQKNKIICNFQMNFESNSILSTLNQIQSTPSQINNKLSGSLFSLTSRNFYSKSKGVNSPLRIKAVEQKQ